MDSQYSSQNIITCMREEEADAVVFETCLYVGAAAFKIEFQVSSLVWRELLWYNKLTSE